MRIFLFVAGIACAFIGSEAWAVRWIPIIPKEPTKYLYGSAYFDTKTELVHVTLCTIEPCTIIDLPDDPMGIKNDEVTDAVIDCKAQTIKWEDALYVNHVFRLKGKNNGRGTNLPNQITLPVDLKVSPKSDFGLIITRLCAKKASLPRSSGPYVIPADPLILKGEAELKDRNYAGAMRTFRIAADQEDVTAQVELGQMYDGGLGVKVDRAKAAYWYEKAAHELDPTGEVMLGIHYVQGDGVPQDYAKAFEEFQGAAFSNDAGGQYQLGLLYAGGLGVHQDVAKARALMTESAGNPRGQSIDATQWLAQHPSVATTQSASDRIAASYDTAFCRPPRPEELQFWSSDPRSASLDALIAAHREWLRKTPADRQAMITRSYLMEFQRAPHADEMAFWDGQVVEKGYTCGDLLSLHEAWKKTNMPGALH